MTQPLLLRGARQLLTLRGERCVRRGPQSRNLEVIEDGSVLIQGGSIVSVGTTRRIENLKEIRGALEVPAFNCVVMPGFVDCSIEVGQQPQTADDGIRQQKRRKAGEIYNDCIALMRSCMLHGTLNAVVRVCSGSRAGAPDLSLLRQLSRIGKHPVGMSRVWCPHVDVADIDAAAKRRLAESIAMTVGDARLNSAVEAGMKIVLEWPAGCDGDLRAAIEKAVPSIVFCHHGLTRDERSALADGKALATFNAGGALLDSVPGSGVRELLDEGGAICLASGYDAVNEQNFNMQLVLAMAVRRLGLSIEEAIVATTINAAYAINCGDSIGSIEPGKRGDLLVLSLADYREIPRRLGVNHVAMAIRNGEIAINRTKWRVGAA